MKKIILTLLLSFVLNYIVLYCISLDVISSFRFTICIWAFLGTIGSLGIAFYKIENKLTRNS